VSEEVTDVSARLAELLEREYQLGLAPPPELTAVHCRSCGRVLYRPADLLGNAWQCHVCGPTTVSEEPVTAPAGATTAGGGEEVSGPFRQSTVPGERALRRVLLFAVVVFALVVGLSAFRAGPFTDYLLAGGLAVAGTGITIGLLGLPLVILMEAHRRRKLKAVDAHLKWTRGAPRRGWPDPPDPDADPHIQRRPETISAGPDGTEAEQIQQQPGAPSPTPISDQVPDRPA
jgi:hypothetical protein